MHIFFCCSSDLSVCREIVLMQTHTHKQTFINLCTINHTVKLLHAPTFLCDKRIQRNQGVRIALYVLNRGHTGNSSYHRERVKDRQTITGGFNEWLRRPKATGRCTGLDLSGSATRLRSAAPDTILYGGSYLQWWNGGEERVQSTPGSKKWEIQTHVRTQSKESTQTHRNISKEKKLTQMEGQADTQSVSHRGASRLLCHSVGTNQNPLD